MRLMALKKFQNLPLVNQYSMAVLITETLKEFVKEGNSVTLAQRLTQNKHHVSLQVVLACCKIAGVNFKYLKDTSMRQRSFVTAASLVGVDVF